MHVIPMTTILGLQFAFFLAGSIVIENVFALPGLGRLVYQAVIQRDIIVVRDYFTREEAARVMSWVVSVMALAPILAPVFGGLIATWADRDLSLAGRISYRDRERQLGSVLIDFKRPVAVIPSLAIHLDREVNNARSINAQTQLPPVLMRSDAAKPQEFRQLLLAQARQQFEHDYLVKVLRLTSGSVTEAALLAQRNRTDFYKLLTRHDLNPDQFKTR